MFDFLNAFALSTSRGSPLFFERVPLNSANCRPLGQGRRVPTFAVPLLIGENPRAWGPLLMIPVPPEETPG